MFTKSILFVFVFIGMFAVLFAAIPGDFFAAQSDYIESSSGMDKEVAEQLTLVNLTVYDVGGQDNMTYEYSSLEDSPSPPSWLITGTTDDFLEVWWGNDPMFGKSIQLRHATRNHIPWEWYGYHMLDMSFANGTETPLHAGFYPLEKQEIEAGWDSEKNVSAFYGECVHTYSSIAFTIHNTTRDATIGEAWDNNEIDYVLSYEKNWNATNINAMTLLGQLLTFQNPNLGVPGFMGTVMNYSIAFPFWVITAVAIIKLIQSILPFIKGVDE